MRSILGTVGIEAPMPGGGFYLWAEAPDGDATVLRDGDEVAILPPVSGG